MLTKLHHCLADGVSGARLLGALFAVSPQSGGEPDWHSEPPPRTGTLLRHAVGDLTGNAVNLVGRALRAPRELTRQITDTLAGLGRMSTVLAPATSSSLTGPIGQARRYAVARAALPDMRAIGAAFGATVNDVALTAITMGYRAVLRHRGEQPDANTVRAAVPVSIRTTDDLGNQISVLLPTLPVEIANPVMALREVHQRLTDLKHSKEAKAATAVAALSGHQPFAFTTFAIQLASRLPQRTIVTVTTNVPGPPTQLAILGRPVLEVFPYVPIAPRLRTAAAALGAEVTS